MKIKNIIGREIYNSRGIPTIECEITLDDDTHITASSPSGASCSEYEAHVIRDGTTRLMGNGVHKAIKNLETIIAPALIGREPNLVQMDTLMLHLDGTHNKSLLGANTIIATSMALCKAQSYVENMEPYEFIAHLCGYDSISLPGPAFNVINGGAHTNNNLQIQEYMLIPIGMESFRQAMEASATVYQAIKQLLREQNKSIAVGDEGGFAPHFGKETDALDCIMEAVRLIEKQYDGSFMIALDVAASQFYDKKAHMYSWQGQHVSTSELIAWYQDIIKKYPIYSIEDGLNEHDWQSWELLAETLNSHVKVVGDDIFATNPERIWEGIERNAAHAAIIKPNQIGTITETLQAIKLCKEHQISTIISHRSGETNDSFIADLAVGTSSDHIKAGGCARGERLAKYNRLLKIEDDLLMNQEL